MVEVGNDHRITIAKKYIHGTQAVRTTRNTHYNGQTFIELALFLQNSFHIFQHDYQNYSPNGFLTLINTNS